MRRSTRSLGGGDVKRSRQGILPRHRESWVQVKPEGQAHRFVGVAEETRLMRLSKNQLDHLQRAARFPPGRTTAREAAASPLAANADGRPDQAMENVIRATEQVARAADNVIRAAQDAT